MPQDYTLFEHRHRFALWAASRAAQRGFTTTARLTAALNACGVVELIGAGPSAWPSDPASFDKAHARWCRALVQHLHQQGIERATFGRAAKLIAIYIKVMVINGGYHDTDFARVAHPPVDSILLMALAANDVYPADSRKLWRKTRWTQLDEVGYATVIDTFRVSGLDNPAFWTLERYWHL